MFRRFLKNYQKYIVRAILFTAVVAAIATGVGAALGAAGVLGGTASGLAGATASVSSMWLGVAEGLGSIATTIGISGLTNSVATAVGITGLSSFAGAAISGASVLLAGLVSLSLGSAFIKTKSEEKSVSYGNVHIAAPVRAPSAQHAKHHTVAPSVNTPHPTRESIPVEPDYYTQNFIPSQAKGGFAEKVRPEKHAQQQSVDGNKKETTSFPSPSVSKAEKLLMTRAQNHGSSAGITA